MRSLREGFEAFGIDPAKPKAETEHRPKKIEPIEHHSVPSGAPAESPLEDNERPERIITTLTTITIPRVDTDVVAQAARKSLIGE